MAKSLPPFGLRLKRYLATGKKIQNNCWLFLGVNAWQKAKAFSETQHVLCLPYGAEPEEYDWTVINGLHPLLIDCGGDFDAGIIRKLAYLLLAAGATPAVHVILFDKRMVIYRKEMVKHECNA